MIIYFESRRTTLVAIRTGRSRTGRTWRSCSRTLTGPTTCPGSGRLGRKRRPGCRQNWRSRPRSRWPNRAAPPYGSGVGDESSAPFFLGPPCDGRVSTITYFAPIVKLRRSCRSPTSDKRLNHPDRLLKAKGGASAGSSPSLFNWTFYALSNRSAKSRAKKPFLTNAA